MREYVKLGITVVTFVFASFAVHAACDPKIPGNTVDCPIFTEPAFTSVPGISMGGTIIVNGGFNSLFNGIIPPNGFMVQIINITGIECWITDIGQASQSNGFHIGGFIGPNIIGPTLFVTPPGYKPVGSVNINCTGSVYLEIRGW